MIMRSLSAIITSNGANRDVLSAGASLVSLHRLSLVIPALCALAYPSLLSLLSSGLVLAHGSNSPDGVIVWVGVIAALTLALAVMLVSFVFGMALASSDIRDRKNRFARIIAHLAFAAPSLYVGFGNVAYYGLHAPSVAPIAWLVFWTLAATAVLLGPRSSTSIAAAASIGYRQLAVAHGVSAIAILVLFIGPHILNHAVSFWSGSAHIAMMNALRHVYRDDIVQPILLVLIGFQILSGTALARQRMRTPSDFLGTLQTMSGVYVGVYLLAHTMAAFATRYAGADTNWIWLTYPKGSMLVSLSNLRLIAHYWLGPIAIFAHVACGLRMVLLQHDVSPTSANRLALAVIGVGIVASSVIVAALLNVHIA